MEKILIVGCKNIMNEQCIACSRCMVAFNKREGEFAKYDKDAQLIGMLSCGGCPGSGVVTRLAQLNAWNAKNKEKPTKVHVSACIYENCPNGKEIVDKIKAKAGVPVIEGTHPYKPENIFA